MSAVIVNSPCTLQHQVFIHNQRLGLLASVPYDILRILYENYSFRHVLLEGSVKFLI